MKLTKSKLKQLIKEQLNEADLYDQWDNRDKIAMLGMRRSEVSNSNFEQIAATWDTSIASDGNPSWKKRHKSESNKFRLAFVTLDLAAGKWEWVVFESKITREEDIIEDDIQQGAANSLRDAILAAEKVLTTR